MTAAHSQAHAGVDRQSLRQWAAQQAPVFIVGPERSGTSVLFRTLSNHARFMSLAGIQETFAFTEPLRLLEQPLYPAVAAYVGTRASQYESDTEELRRLNQRLTLEGVASGRLAERKKDPTLWERRQFEPLIACFFHNAWLASGERRIVEKTPAHIRCVADILRVFPRARFVLCVRNPLDIVASHKRRLLHQVERGKPLGDPSLKWLRQTNRELATYLNWTAKLSAKLLRSGVPVFLVQYERFTRQPEEKAAQLFEFLGEEFGTGVLAGSDAAKASNPWDPLLGGRIVENQSYVEIFFTPEEQARLDESLAPARKTWGYL